MMYFERGPDNGDRRPIAVVAALHGDEPCGVYAIAEFLASHSILKRQVRFIIANERALEAGKRCIDDDLNRVFPGNPTSDSYERRLAAQLTPILEGAEVLTLHSTNADPTPFALIQDLDETTDEIIRGVGVANVVDISYVSGGLESLVDGIAVECGPIGSKEAAETARSILERFLTARGAVPGTVSNQEPNIFRVVDQVDGGNLEFCGTNFEHVTPGEVFAQRPVKSSDVSVIQTVEYIRAENAFYPVLMATDGYDDMLGFQAEYLGALADITDRWRGPTFHILTPTRYRCCLHCWWKQHPRYRWCLVSGIVPSSEGLKP